MNIIFKIFALSTLSILISCTSEKSNPSIKGQKIAYVDPEQIIPSMPEYIKAKEEFESLKSKMQSELEAEQGKAQSYYANVMSKVQQGSMSPAQQKQEEEKLMKMQEILQKKAMQMEEQMVAKEQEMTKPMYDKFNEALKEIAKSEGYIYVFDKKMMLYSEGGIDATPSLKKKLGIK